MTFCMGYQIQYKIRCNYYLPRLNCNYSTLVNLSYFASCLMLTQNHEKQTSACEIYFLLFSTIPRQRSSAAAVECIEHPPVRHVRMHRQEHVLIFMKQILCKNGKFVMYTLDACAPVQITRLKDCDARRLRRRRLINVHVGSPRFSSLTHPHKRTHRLMFPGRKPGLVFMPVARTRVMLLCSYRLP